MLNQEKKDILNEYARTKMEVKLLEAKLEELNFQVLGIMEDNKLGEVDISDYGKLTLGSRRSWIYSGDLQNKEKELKEAKKDEEREGIANYSEKKYVLFKSLKEE